MFQSDALGLNKIGYGMKGTFVLPNKTLHIFKQPVQGCLRGQRWKGKRSKL